MESTSWSKTWGTESARFGNIDPELKTFLLDKCWFDPPPLYGKKDGPVGGKIALLKGIFHAHMHFGKVVIIYKVEAESIRLYVAGDHKIVEKDFLGDLGRQIKNLDKLTWTSSKPPDRAVTSDVTPDVESAAMQLIELLNDDPATRNLLYRFQQDLRNAVPLLPYFNYEPLILNLPLETLQGIVRNFFKKSS